MIKWTVLLLVPFLLTAEPKFIGNSDLNRFDREALTFSLSFRGVAAARARMRCETLPEHLWRIQVDTDTKFWADLVFPVSNRYITLIDQPSGRVVQIDKKIKQKNLKQEMAVFYDYSAGRAHASHGFDWEIGDELQTLFSLLYQLRGMDPAPTDSLGCLLEIESQLWVVTGKVEIGEPVEGSFSDQPVRRIVLDFVPQSPLKPRDWKTDLLTNRFGRQGQLILKMGPAPENLPLWMQIGGGTNPVSMKLLSRKKG